MDETMRHSQRRALAKKERDFLKGSDTESSRYRHAVLTEVREVRAIGQLVTMSLLLLLIACLEKRADYLAAVGAIIAVFGVLRFRAGYVERLKQNNARFMAILPDGRDDAAKSEERMRSALTGAERNGLWLAAAGTLVNGFSGLVGHYYGWIN